MGCPEPEMLAQLAGPGGDPDTRAAIADHAATCRSCHAALAMLLVEVSPVAETVAETIAPFATAALEKVDRYVIKRRLGAGGMGVVYEASDPELGRSIAIKMLRRGAPAARLRREAQALARLDHRNVVAVHDVGEHDGQVFVAMALVDGDNLRQWLAHERTTAEILRVLVSAGRGLAAAHAAGLIHRDLKPDNIFVARDGDVLVGDFGLARDASDADEPPADVGAAATNLTMTGMVLGTPAYMAPEQADGTATARSDQFSFCVTAYEALYGARPFAGDNLEAVLENIRAGRIAPRPPPRPVPTRIARALRRGLAAAPEARFPDLAPLLAELEPRRRAWLRWTIPAGALAIAAIAIVVATRSRTHRAPDCSAARGELATVWSPGRRAAIAGALRARMPPEGATALAAGLDDYASRWIAVREATCAADGDRLTGEQVGAALACLTARRTELDRVAQRIANDTTTDALGQWHRITSLAPVEACRDDASARLAVGDPAHRELMQAIAARDSLLSRPTDFAPLRARAVAAHDQAALLEIDLLVGGLLLGAGATHDAEVPLQNALAVAQQLGVAPARLRALALLAMAACKQQKLDASGPLLTMAESDARAATASVVDVDFVERARALCLAQRGTTEAIPALKALIDRSIAHYGLDSPDQLDLHLALGNVYYQLGKLEDGQRETAAFDRIALRFVPPGLASAQREEASATAAIDHGDVGTAIAHQRRAVELWDTEHVPERAMALAALATDYEMSAAWQLAAATHAQLIALVPPDHAAADLRGLRVEALIQAGSMALIAGDTVAAGKLYDAAATEARAIHRDELALDADLGRGRVAVETGDAVRGVRLLRDGLATFAKQPAASAYRLGLCQFAFARALWDTGDHPAAVAAARDAEQNLGKAVEQAKANPLGTKLVPFRAAVVAQVAAWRDAHH